MEEFGEQAELVNELFMEQQKEEGERHQPNWHRQVAISTLLLALFAAVGALMAGITSHEIVIQRTQELLDVSVAENDRVSIEVLKAKHEILVAMNMSPNAAELAEIQAWDEEERRLESAAEREEEEIEATGYLHLIFALAVTVLSIAITLSGMSPIVEQKSMWYAGLVLGAVGVIGVLAGIAIRLFG